MHKHNIRTNTVLSFLTAGPFSFSQLPYILSPGELVRSFKMDRYNWMVTHLKYEKFQFVCLFFVYIIVIVFDRYSFRQAIFVEIMARKTERTYNAHVSCVRPIGFYRY